MWLCRVARGERESVNARVITASRKAAATPGRRESGSEDRGPEAARARRPGTRGLLAPHFTDGPGDSDGEPGQLALEVDCASIPRALGHTLQAGFVGPSC